MLSKKTDICSKSTYAQFLALGFPTDNWRNY